jgi:hypothetical protein
MSCPPKPNELLKAAMSPLGSSRGLLITTSTSTPSAKLTRLPTGGTMRFLIAKMEASAASEPAPPSK